MNKVIISLIAAILFVACKNEKKVNTVANEDSKGIYEAKFIDVNNTEIPADIDQNVLMESRLLGNINLVEHTQFWESKSNFYVHAMGSLDNNEYGTYHFKLTCAGKIKFKLNNKDLVKNDVTDKKETYAATTYLEVGPTIFEYEYFPGNLDPYLVLEWSRDGENFVVVPDSLFNNLEAWTVQPWEGDEETSEPETQADNTLTSSEIQDGWNLLFDGNTTTGWHTYNKPGQIGSKWKAENGALIFEGRSRFEFLVAGRRIEIGPVDKEKDGGKDIVTDQVFDNFELALEWKISEGGNNGIFYTVKEDEKYDEVWKTSPEMQVIDNLMHKDGLIKKHQAGDLYDLIASKPIRVKPLGHWNKVRIIKDHGKVEHWLNGSKIVSYDLNSEAWKDMISKSKFADLKDFATPGPGNIGFQDHDNKVYYKNIKIKVLD
jgi:hypothetical protein